jgi:hypothetical protein
MTVQHLLFVAHNPAERLGQRFFSVQCSNGGGVKYKVGDNWLTFISLYYPYKGNSQRETTPFHDFTKSADGPALVEDAT